MNQVVLVGRIAQDLEIKEQEEKKICTVTIAVQRSFKNLNGEYETDFIPCVLWNGIAANTMEYCRKGDTVGIKGRIQSNEKGIYIIVEKATFLSSNKHSEGEENEHLSNN